MFKKGDTLIEVTIAIGIFSLIAITIATVMSSGTAGSQNALETLITRQEIDAQADALRFIHESYITNKDPESNPYADIWNKIISKAQNANGALAQFTPTTCQELYDPNNGQVFKNGGFIINTRDLSSASSIIEASSNSTPNTNQFTTTSTYPRLLFNNRDKLEDNLSDTSLSKAEGIYVFGVKGTDANIVAGDGAISYYDFYIRSCWYDANSETPTTISTLIRLSDAPATESAGPSKISILTVDYYNNYGKAGDFYKPKNPIAQPTKIELNQPGPLRNLRDEGWGYYRFNGWCSVEPNVDTNDCNSESFYPINSSITNTNGGRKSLYAIWNKDPFIIKFDAGDGEFPDGTTTKIERCDAFTSSCEPTYTIPDKYLNANGDEAPTRSGYYFAGWSTKPTPEPSTSINLYESNGSTEITLNAIWRDQNETITIRAEWTSDTDYDSYMKLSKPNSNYYQSANWGTDHIDVTYNGQTYSLITGAGDGRGNINKRYYENFVINTLGGKNYYYSIKNWSNPGTIGNDITVKITGDYMQEREFKSTARTNCIFWNVFAYKNGRIVERNTCSNSMEYDY